MKPRKISPRDIGFYLIILIVLIASVYLLATGTKTSSVEIRDYSEVRRIIESGDVEYFAIEDNIITMKLKEPYKDTDCTEVWHELYNVSIFYNDMSEKIDELMVSSDDFNYTYKVGWQLPWWASIIPYVLIMAVFFILWGVMANRAGMGGALQDTFDGAHAEGQCSFFVKTKKGNPLIERISQ